MPESRLERTRRAYDRVIDMGPMGCKILDIGMQDVRVLNQLWRKDPIRSVDEMETWNRREVGMHS